MLQWYVCPIVILLLVLTGCGGSDDEGLQLTRTEQLRLQLDPQIGSYMARSEMALKQGNYVMALALVDSVELLVPDLADAPFMRGRIFGKINQLEQSSIAYQQALALDPEYKGANHNMGLNAYQSGLLRQAVDFYKQEEAIEPTSVVFLEMGKTYAKLGEPDSARMAYERAIEMDPENASAHMWLGQLMEEMGELDKALDYSLKGAALKPDNPDYEYIIGSIYLRKGDNDKAIEYLKPVAEKKQWHQGAQYNLGQALMRSGAQQEAQIYLAQADSAQQMQQALNEARDAVNTNPGSRDAWVTYAELQWKVDDKNEAINSYQVAISIDPGNFAMQNNLANMLIQNDRKDEGIRRLQAMLRLKPDLVDGWLNLGAAYANDGYLEEARTVWTKGLEFNPNDHRLTGFLRQLDQMEAAKG